MNFCIWPNRINSNSFHMSGRRWSSNVKQEFVYWLKGYSKTIINRNVLVFSLPGRTDASLTFQQVVQVRFHLQP